MFAVLTTRHIFDRSGILSQPTHISHRTPHNLDKTIAHDSPGTFRSDGNSHILLMFGIIVRNASSGVYGGTDVGNVAQNQNPRFQSELHMKVR